MGMSRVETYHHHHGYESKEGGGGRGNQVQTFLLDQHHR
jgi:hypothetical protein